MKKVLSIVICVLLAVNSVLGQGTVTINGTVLTDGEDSGGSLTITGYSANVSWKGDHEWPSSKVTTTTTTTTTTGCYLVKSLADFRVSVG